MNKVPNVHPGEKFEDFWAKDRAETEIRDFEKALHKDYPDYH